MEALIPVGLIQDLNDLVNYYEPHVSKVICENNNYVEIVLVGDITITILENSKFIVDGLGKYVETSSKHDVKECVDILILMNKMWEERIKKDKEGT